MEDENTQVFNTDSIYNKVVEETLKEISNNLKERGYNPINQLTGYIISGDLGYISNYKQSRNKISQLERNDIVEILLKNILS